MLTLLLDPQSEQPLYEQIYLQIKAEIETGRISPGEQVPSKRALSQHLKVSIVTIEGAYSQLLAEGYLRSEARKGFFVQRVEGGCHVPPSPSSLLFQTSPETQSDLIYRFSTNGVDTTRFPFSTWARLMREVLSEERSALLESTHPQGAPELRSAIVRYLHQFRGIEVDPAQIVVGAGSEYLTGLLLQLLGREGGYGVEDPGYPKFPKILSRQGALICPIPLDEQGLRVDALRWSGARVAHVTPSHHFPLGTVMPVARRRALLAWADEAPDRYIIEDDYDSEFRYSGRPIPALQRLDGRERVIYLNTFAQNLAPSLRVSFLVLPVHLLERYQRDFLFYANTVPAFEQHTLARFLDGGYFERHIARMRTAYRVRRDAFLSAARAAHISDLGTLSGAEAGLHLLLTMKQMEPSEQVLIHRAAVCGVGVAPLSDYCLTPQNRPPTLLLGYGRMPVEDIAPALTLLRDAWANLY